MQTGLLTDIIIILGLSVTVMLVILRFRVPAIIGYLLTGILAGPHGLRLIGAVHEVELISEVGVVLLLFSIGIEFSLRNLLQIRRAVFVGGTLQVVLTVSVCALIASGLGFPAPKALFFGFLFALSSTAVVLKILTERAQIETPHGKIALAILIFQDMVVVPMMILTPLLAGMSGPSGTPPLILVARGCLLILFLIAAYKWIVPALLFQVAKTKSRELFLISVVFICFSVAWLTSSMGLSLALGAFLAGLIISESEYSHEALGRILPSRDIFVSFFFISIGMLMDVGFLLGNPAYLMLLTACVIFIKVLTGAIATGALGYPLRTVVLTGLALAQVGEFSFILSRSGMELGLLDEHAYQLFLNISLLSMAVTPALIHFSAPLAEQAMRLPLPLSLKQGRMALSPLGDPESAAPLTDHLIIIGFGVNGRNVARAANRAGIPFCVLELNPETVRAEREAGVPIVYGDACQDAVLTHVRIEHARTVVTALPDAASTRRIVSLARQLNPRVHIIARTRFIAEVGPLFDLGADEVVPEEFEVKRGKWTFAHLPAIPAIPVSRSRLAVSASIPPMAWTGTGDAATAVRSRSMPWGGP